MLVAGVCVLDVGGADVALTCVVLKLLAVAAVHVVAVAIAVDNDSSEFFSPKTPYASLLLLLPSLPSFLFLFSLS